MGADYNEQAPDGSWRHVTQNPDGSYNRTTIPPSGYAAAGITGGSGGGATYQTQSGQLTVAQMLAGLDAAANGTWTGNRSDPNAVAAAYNAAPAGGAAGGYGFNPSAAQYAIDAANSAVDNQIKQGQLDLAKLSQTWLQAYQTAQLTGTFNGQPTLAAQGQNNQEALDLMKFDASLSGPANAFEYAKALEGTPNGLSDIVRAASSQYQLPGTGGGNGQPITPLSIQSIISDINKYSPASAPAAPSTPAGTPPPAAAPQVAAPQVATATPPTAAPQTATSQTTTAASGGATPPSYVPDYGPLPSPNGIAPQAWNQMDPSQQQLLLAAYGQAGYNQQDVLAEFNKSLKGYGGPSSGSVGF